MKDGNIDKRIIKTKIAIHSAFKKLINEKEMADISISELTKEAAITRSTFYMYYNTIADVRDDIENAIIDRLDEIMSNSNLATAGLDPYPLLNALTNEIIQFDEKNKYILNENNSGRLMEKMSLKVVDKFIDFINKNNLGDASKGKYFAIFCASGVFESFKMWYNHPSSLSLEELCRRMSNYIKKCLVVITAPDEA